MTFIRYLINVILLCGDRPARRGDTGETNSQVYQHIEHFPLIDHYYNKTKRHEGLCIAYPFFTKRHGMRICAFGVSRFCPSQGRKFRCTPGCEIPRRQNIPIKNARSEC